jgi:hypothetical protein
MSENKLTEEELHAPIVDYVIHQYGLTREEAREVVRQSAGDRAMVDAEAGRLKAQKRP